MEWNIQKIGKQCAACSMEFKEEQSFFSAIYLSDEEVQRKDFCPLCWGVIPPEQKPFSFWSSAVPKKDGPKPDNRKNIQQVFEKLYGTVALSEGEADPGKDLSEEARKKLVFLLALTLMRKRILKLVKSESEGENELMVMEKTADGSVFKVQVIKLPEEDITMLKDDLARIMES